MNEAERNRLPLLIAAVIPGLVVQFSLEYLRFLSRRRKGVRIFERTLVAGGMPRVGALKLAETYHDVGSIRRFLKARSS